MKLPSIRIGGVDITLSTQFFLWPILLIAALFLAQSLKMAVSHMVFVFVLLMPIGAIYTTLLVIAAVGLNKICSEIKSAGKPWRREFVYRFCMVVIVIPCLLIVLLNATGLLH